MFSFRRMNACLPNAPRGRLVSRWKGPPVVTTVEEDKNPYIEQVVWFVCVFIGHFSMTSLACFVNF